MCLWPVFSASDGDVSTSMLLVTTETQLILSVISTAPVWAEIPLAGLCQPHISQHFPPDACESWLIVILLNGTER